MRSGPALLLVFALAGCVSPSGPIAPAANPNHSGVVRSPEVMRGAGLENVIGARAVTLTSRFGAPRIDLAEGDARKLQFLGQSCVLDIYLYPLEPGAEPVATHIEARLRQNGREVDRSSCIREVERRR